jgi:hypothetical protein
MREVLLALIGFHGVLGFWIGEGGLQLWTTLPVAAGVIGCLLVAFISPGRWRRKGLTGSVSLIVYIAAVGVGSLSFERAFNECLAKGEEVRGRLGEYQRANGRYPERLAQLHGPTPCGRVLRPTILEYARTPDGYVLSFRDWLVEHSATGSTSFHAHK